VEIDPVVVSFARKYFSLPAPHETIIDDAVSVTSNLAAQGKKFNYIVHDVFTGGAEPVNLFTYEFLKDLYDLLEPGGVIAIVCYHLSSPPPSLHPSRISSHPLV
jgi:spermidine synthase